MQQTGECRIAAPREQVWLALNDPAVLQRCIDGCELLQRTGEHQFTATVRAKVGPVSASFKGDVALTDLVPSTSYTLTGSGSGGVAGFARGSARVALSDITGGTLLHYEMDAKVGGKLAQIGSRLVDGAARKMADDFFARLCAVLAPDSALADAGGAAADGSAVSEQQSPPGASATDRLVVDRQPSDQQWIIWTVVFAVLALALILAAL